MEENTANAGAGAFAALSPHDLKHPGGLLSRAGSGASSSSSGSGSSSSGVTSLFDRLSCSDSSDRRSSFASSVDSARCCSSWAKEGSESEELLEEQDGGSNDGLSSNNDEFYDLQTPTVEFGGNANAGAALPATAKHAERLRGAGASASSTASTAVSSPSTIRANSDESARTVKRPPTRSGGGGTPLSSEGFPWNATSNTTSHSMHKVLSSSSSLGTPSAIFSSGMEEPESDSGSEDQGDVNSPGGAGDHINAEAATFEKTRRLSSSHSTGGRASSSSSAGSSTHQSINAAGRNYERGSIDHHRPSTSSSTTRMFGYAAGPTSIGSPRLPSAPSSPSLSMDGLGGVPSSSAAGQYPYPGNKRVSNSAANNSGGRAASSSLQHNRSSPDMHSQLPSSSARPSTASSVASNSSRPWVKDSDASSVKSSSGMSSDGSLQDESGDTLSVMSPAAPPPVPCELHVAQVSSSAAG